MKKIFSSLFAIAMSSSLLLGGLISAYATSEDENPAPTISFETDAALAEFEPFESADTFITLEITDEKSYTAKALKITADTTTNSPKDGYMGFEFSASSFRLSSFAGCRIEMQAYFPAGINASLPYFQLISKDPSYIKCDADTLVTGKWQTLTVDVPSSKQNDHIGVVIPVAAGIPAGTTVCYIDDIKVIDSQGNMIASKDMDPNLTPEQRAVTTVSEQNDDEEDTSTSGEVSKPDSYVEEEDEFPLALILVISLVVVAIVAIVIFVLVSKNKNKYY